MTVKPYDFQRQLDKGKEGEALLDAFFAPAYRITKSTESEQRQEIDRWFVNRKSGKRFSVEYKTDSIAGKTGNAFVETESNHEWHTPGWARMSAADYLIYFIPEPETIYVLAFTDLRKRLPEWAKRYPTKGAPNAKYTTWGLLVPLTEFERCAIDVY